MPVIITITLEPVTVAGGEGVYYYDDRILRNISNNEYEVFYSGQNQGRLDYQLTRAIGNNDEYKIYYRKKKNKPYIYLGSTHSVTIVRDRTIAVGENSIQSQKLLLHLNNITIHNNNVPENTFTGPGRYKKDILVHAGLRNINNEQIIPHNKNFNLGFYSY